MKDGYWLGLSRVPGWGNKGLLKLIQEFSSVQELWHCPESKLLGLRQFPPQQIEAFLQFRRRFDPVKEMELLARQDINLVHLEDSNYSERLRMIYDPPLVLYYRGDVSLLKADSVAIVGSRKATAYGKGVAARLAGELGESGLAVVSGMAYGIDTAAHRGALQAGAKTVAVLGCGVNVCYPRRNHDLYAKISEKGLVVSEFAPDTPPEARNFPIRNRIISGLSMGVVVVEAALKSGSLITAQLALEQGKEVMAVPGAVTSSNSKGTHSLLRDGAALVESAADVTFCLGLTGFFPQTAAINYGSLLSSEEQAVLHLVSGGPVHIDRLAAETGYGMERLQSMLLYLEVKGLVSKLPGSFFQSV